MFVVYHVSFQRDRLFLNRAFLAQLVEHPPCKRKVLGSIPRGGIHFCLQTKWNTRTVMDIPKQSGMLLLQYLEIHKISIAK